MLARIKSAFFILLLLSSVRCFADNESLTFIAEELPPLHFLNADQRVDGFLVDVTRAVVARTEFNANFEIMPQARAFDSAQQETNVFMMSLLRSDTREKQFQWVGAVYQTKGFLLGLKSRQDIKLTTLDDAKPFIVGTIRGYFAETFLHQNGFDDKSNMALAVRYDHLWGMLFKGHVDLILTNALSQQIEIARAGYDPSMVQRYLDLSELTRELHIATGLKTARPVVAALQKALREVKDNGEYDILAQKWKIEK